jgi:acyl-CoA dehydrogenase
MGWLWLLLALAGACVLAYQRASVRVASIGMLLYMLVLSTLGPVGWIGLGVLWFVVLVVLVPFNSQALRLHWMTPAIMTFFTRMMPGISSTEEAALASGTVGFEGSLLAGIPDWKTLQLIKHSRLSEKEQAFIEGPVEAVCQMIRDWEITRFPVGVPDAVWQFLKVHGFFSMIIPESYGGLGFSARAHSEVICKLGSANGAVGTVCSVPNSLGPGELLLQYGTEAQKDHYLPRLSSGEEIPCFALTSAWAGSDAGAMQDRGIVCQREVDGEVTLGFLLHFSKRYITLAPVATLVGLAFKAYDPDGLLGSEVDLGITCALLASTTPGISIGRHHWPLNSAFPNGPIQGEAVFITLDQVIGGQARIGQGWRMLMECLSMGRGISIPSIYTAGARKAALTSGAYSRVREQFGVAIASFGGVQEALATMAAHALTLEAMRCFITTALDAGERPAVAAAISKYHSTELGREAINLAMDVHGGKGICMGPRNYLAQSHIETPIGVTVEGANILTRSMMIFGQGIMRCHPFLLKEIHALEVEDKNQRLKNFDEAFMGHVGHYVASVFRSFALSITHAWLPVGVASPYKRYYQHFSRFSANLAWLSDIALAVYGGGLKRKETVSARLGDMLSYLYQGSCVLSYAKQHPELASSEVVDFICQRLCYQMQETMADLIRGLPPLFRWLGRALCMPLGKRYAPPADRVMASVAEAISTPSALRDALASNLYATPSEHNPAGQMNAALATVIAASPLEKTVRKAWKSGAIKADDFSGALDAALKEALITSEDHAHLLDVATLRFQLIAVDDFSCAELEKLHQSSMQGRASESVV